jgi:hypothetical protein
MDSQKPSEFSISEARMKLVYFRKKKKKKLVSRVGEVHRPVYHIVWPILPVLSSGPQTDHLVHDFSTSEMNLMFKVATWKFHHYIWHKSSSQKHLL